MLPAGETGTFGRCGGLPGPPTVEELEVDIMQARDIMTRPVITFRPETPVRHAAAVLTRKQITAAPVVNAEDELVGMVSEADLIVDRFPPDPRSRLRREDSEATPPQTVGEVMTTTVIAMSGSADAADLAHAMVEYDVRSIPVVTGSAVVGIVSRRDLLKTLVRDDDVVRAEVMSRIETYTGGQTGWEVEVHDGQVHLGGNVDDDAEARVLLILARTVPGVTHAVLHRADLLVHQFS
jgi:CBS domain-containing protein